MSLYIGADKLSQSLSEDRRVYVATAGQTTFACIYTVGYLDVTLNGIKLNPLVDFTATDGQTVVLTLAASLGDEVQTIGRISSRPYDYYTKSQIDAKIPVYGTATGTGNAMIFTSSPALTALTDGMEIKVRVPGGNTVTAPTITFTDLSVAKTLTKLGGQPLVSGDYSTNQEITLRYNVTSGLMEVVSLLAIASSSPGDVKYVCTPTAPTGWFKANGAAVSRTTYSNLYTQLITSQGFTSQTFTITIAAPAVVTRTAHGFLGGERLRLFTSGALPTGLNTTTDYFVGYIDANTFNLTNLTGTAITTTGTQSGTQSYLQSLWGLGDGSTTFNIPDLRGEFIRSWDDSRGVDPSRSFSSVQLDTIKAHTHGYYTYDQPGIGNAGGGGARVNAGASQTFSQTPTGGTETRPRNISLLAVVKY